MKTILLLAAAAFILLGCAPHLPEGRVTVTVHGSAPDRDNSQPWALAFVVAKQRFGTIEEFKAFIATLPPGSVVRWDSGCIRYEIVPLAHSEMSIQDFTAYCKRHSVTFEHVVSGY